MALQQVYEGTSDEITAKLRLNYPSGRLKAIVSQDELLVYDNTETNLGASLADFLSGLDSLEFVHGSPPSNEHKREFSRLIADKLARLGHTE